MPTLPAGEALAADDSLWASFRAGRAPAASLVAEARAIAAHPDSNASLIGGQRLAGLRARGLIDGPMLGDYHRIMASVFGPKLESLGFDPSAGAYAAEAPDRQKLRQDLMALVAGEAKDAAINAKLVSAAKAYLAGDAKALDQGYLSTAFIAYVKAGGLEAAKTVMEKGLSSENTIVRGSLLGALPAAGSIEVGQWLIAFNDPRLRPLERLNNITSLAGQPETRDLAGDWILANFDKLTAGANGIFVTARLPSALRLQCSAERATKIEQVMGPKVRALGQGQLDFERTVEVVRHCGDLKAARAGDLAAALKAGA